MVQQEAVAGVEIPEESTREIASDIA